MKFTQADTAHLSTILATCAVGGIDSIVIEDGYVRGVNPTKNFAIISNYEVPKFPQKIGISRLSLFRQRLDLFANNDSTIIEAKESDRGEISSIEIVAGRSKAQYRCTSTILIKAPKAINDEEIYGIIISKSEMKILLSAAKAMTGGNAQLVIKKDRTTSLILSDGTNDTFAVALEEPAVLKNGVDEQDSLVHYYDAQIIHALLKSQDSEVSGFIIGYKGTIRTKINGHDVIVLPKINEEEE